MILAKNHAFRNPETAVSRHCPRIAFDFYSCDRLWRNIYLFFFLLTKKFINVKRTIKKMHNFIKDSQ